MSEDFFGGIENEQSSTRHPFLSAGSYAELEVIGLSGFKNRKKENMVAAEYRIVSSIGETANPAGTTAVHLINLSKDGAKGNVRNLVAGLLAIPEASVTGPVVNKTIPTPENVFTSPAIGTKVAAEAVSITKKSGDGQWLKVNYMPYSGGLTATLPPPTEATTATKSGKRA